MKSERRTSDSIVAVLVKKAKKSGNILSCVKYEKGLKAFDKTNWVKGW